MNPYPYLTLPEAAERLGVSAPTVRRHIRSKSLRATRIGKLWRISPADLAAFCERGVEVQP